jgi:hypothetical protein
MRRGPRERAVEISESSVQYLQLASSGCTAHIIDAFQDETTRDIVTHLFGIVCLNLIVQSIDLYELGPNREIADHAPCIMSLITSYHRLALTHEKSKSASH